MDERQLTTKIVNRLREIPHSYTIKMHGNRYMPMGVPDILFMMKGITVWFEVKTETGRLQPTQIRMIKILSRVCNGAHVIRNVDDALFHLAEHGIDAHAVHVTNTANTTTLDNYR